MSDYLFGIDVTVAQPKKADAGDIGAAVVAEVESARPDWRASVKGRVLRSEIEGVTDGQWTDFVLALATSTLGAVSASNAMGMFEMKPRRLADIGVAESATCTKSPTGGMAWTAKFVAPMTAKKFLRDSEAQYDALCRSMRDYMARMHDGALDLDEGDELPADMTLSGALAVLHRCGPNGLRRWLDEEERFSDTVALYERCNGIF